MQERLARAGASTPVRAWNVFCVSFNRTMARATHAGLAGLCGADQRDVSTVRSTGSPRFRVIERVSTVDQRDVSTADAPFCPRAAPVASGFAQRQGLVDQRDDNEPTAIERANGWRPARPGRC